MGGENINIIKKLRLEKGITQAALADAVGVTQGAVVQWEKGVAFPNAAKILKVASILSCEPEVLIQEAERREKLRQKAG